MNILRELRTKKGVYQKDVAKYLGVDRTTYVKYERGDSEPSIDIIKKLANYFDVTVDFLVGEEKKANTFYQIFWYAQSVAITIGECHGPTGREKNGMYGVVLIVWSMERSTVKIHRRLMKKRYRERLCRHWGN